MDKLISELLIPPERVRKGDFGELLVSVLPWRKKNRHRAKKLGKGESLQP